jgi:hypothetical protein
MVARRMIVSVMQQEKKAPSIVWDDASTADAVSQILSETLQSSVQMLLSLRKLDASERDGFFFKSQIWSQEIFQTALFTISPQHLEAVLKPLYSLPPKVSRSSNKDCSNSQALEGIYIAMANSIRQADGHKMNLRAILRDLTSGLDSHLESHGNNDQDVEVERAILRLIRQLTLECGKKERQSCLRAYERLLTSDNELLEAERISLIAAIVSVLGEEVNSSLPTIGPLVNKWLGDCISEKAKDKPKTEAVASVLSALVDGASWYYTGQVRESTMDLVRQALALKLTPASEESLARILAMLEE